MVKYVRCERAVHRDIASSRELVSAIAGKIIVMLFRGRTAMEMREHAFLYGGMPGVILFFLYANRHLRLAECDEVLDTLCRHETRLMDSLQKAGVCRIGAFDGWSGWAYVLLHLGLIRRQSQFLEEALRILRRSGNWIDDSPQADVISGLAGWILIATEAYRVTGDSALSKLVNRAAKGIIGRAHRQKVGIAWESIGSSAPLVGFAHGASGIAYSLFKAFKVTGDERYLAYALDGLRYESLAFIQKDSNWDDYRSPRPAHAALPVAWCHGAAGIALARSHLCRDLGGPALVDELRIAIRTTCASGLAGLDYCLCHGVVGNLAILVTLELHRWLADEAESASDRWLNVMRELRDRLDSTANPAIPVGLMKGWAGIGFGVLREGFRVETPCVLSLETPHAIGSRSPSRR